MQATMVNDESPDLLEKIAGEDELYKRVTPTTGAWHIDQGSTVDIIKGPKNVLSGSPCTVKEVYKIRHVDKSHNSREGWVYKDNLLIIDSEIQS